jgi:O-antigen/teichoic acid export membrane protein
LLTSLEKVVLGVSVILIALAMSGSGWIADRWFNVKALSEHDVEIAFVLMVGTVSARWLASLYKGAIVGLARQVELNAITIVCTVLRTVAVIPLIARIPSIEAFFVYQLAMTMAEAAALRYFLGRRVGSSPFVRTFSSSALRSRARLSLSLAFSSLVWASITQVDRIILSKLLPLDAFGAFGMATLLAGGILLLAAPIHQALIPHFAVQHDSGDSNALTDTYYFATEITLLAVLPVAAVFACLPESVFRLWSSTVPADATARFTLTCYALGNACTAVTALSYLLQYTKGDLSLHVKGNVGFLIALVPLVFIGASLAAVRGVATVWLASNLVFVLGWVAVVHRKFLPGINKRWYGWLAMRSLCVAAVGIALSRADFSGLSRIALFFALVGCWLLLVSVTLAMSPLSQQKARAWVRLLIERRAATKREWRNRCP